VKKSWTDFEALKDINIDIKKGEQVGLIGVNGCGKSTLLKCFSKILYPDKGEIIVNGKVSSLLELGAGFHPDFSGRENIYTNASIFGLKRKEIESIINPIIEFSGLSDFIENPVRTYSSGMYMRLAFSVAIHVSPDILLIDEILAVGDASFQKKCYERILDFKGRGITIVIVSHDLSTVERICDRIIWLDGGKIIKDGSPKEVVNDYYDKLFSGEKKSAAMQKAPPENNNKSRWGSLAVEFTEAEILDLNGKPCFAFDTEDGAIIRLQFKNNSNETNFVFGIGIFSADNEQLYGTNTYIEKLEIPQKSNEASFKIDRLGLISGSYRIDIACHDVSGVPFDYQLGRLEFSVNSKISDVGRIRLPHKWIFNKEI
ncbi:MAG: ABC transporter ATP-binding protein, partial [Oscillospiraceae bacterium]